MADTDLTINLKLIDEATAEINQSMESIKNQTDKVKDSSEKAAKSIKEQFKEAGKSLRDFRKTLSIITIAIAAVIATTREAAKYNEEAEATYRSFATSIQVLAVTLGQILGPALIAITNVVNVLRDSITGAVAGFIKLGSFITEFFANITSGPVEAYRRAMEVANEATDLFLAKTEQTRVLVEQGLDLTKQRKQAALLETIHVKSAERMKLGYEATRDAIGMLGDALANAEVLGKDFAIAAAAVAMGMAVINVAEGITTAWKVHGWNPPLATSVSAIIAAAGAIQIATIAAQSFHEGGMIRAHNGLAVDEVPIIAQTGEGILSRRGMAALGGASALNSLNAGGSGGTTISVNMENVSFRSEDDIEDVMTRLSNLISTKTRSRT